MSSTGTKEVPTENNNKSEKRKSRLRPITPIELPQKTRIVKFKQSGKIESLPIDYELNVKFLPKQITYDNCKDFEISENKNGKIKNKSKLIKKPKLSTFQIYPISNVKLPEPKFKILKQKGKDYREPCEASFAYYRYLEHNENNDDNEESDVEYDMDEEDSIWLDKMNKKRKSERLIDVDDDTFEMLMDRLEKESFFQSQYNGKDAPAIDEDAVCCICYDGECQNSNAILFCDMCNLAVHQECYGVPYIPEGQWLCRRCMQSPSRAVDCALCPNKDGAFKQTDDNRWAHVICALWIPEVCFANTVFLEPIDSIGAIPQARWKLNCVVCLKREGACIQCHKSNCYTAFHVTCAQRTGLYMKIEAVKESSSQGMSIRKTAYCSLHAPSKNGNSNGLYSSGDEDGKTESRKTKKVLELSGKKGPELLLPIVSIPTIPIDRLQRISETVLFPRRNEFLVRLYAYWKLKRQSRNGAPLLRKLQNSNSLMRLDLKEKSKRDHNKFQSQYQKIYQIRCDLEKVRLLLEQIKKRERQKTFILKDSRSILIYELIPYRYFLITILEKVWEKDEQQYFIEPVDTIEVNDYLLHIEFPMDLGTMRKKAEHNQYTTFEQFKKDLYLIISNCLSYNDAGSIWSVAALKLKDFIDSLLEECEPLAAIYNQQTGLHIMDHID